MNIAEPLSKPSSLCADYSHNDDLYKPAGAWLLIKAMALIRLGRDKE